MINKNITIDVITRHIQRHNLVPHSIRFNDAGAFVSMTASAHILLKNRRGLHPDLRRLRWDSEGLCRLSNSPTRSPYFDIKSSDV